MSTPTATRAPAVVPDAWLRRFRPLEAAAVRLVCFPHAGGSASSYLPLASALAPTGVEVLAVQYPGRQERRSEPFARSVEELVEALLPELRQWTGGPFALFGHSLGATLAYETARRLAEYGRQPVHLFLSGRRAPTVARLDTGHLLDDRGLVALIAGLQGTEPALLANDELLRMVLPAIRADYEVAGAYVHRPGPALRMPVTVLTGDSDPNVSVQDAMRWSEVAAGPFGLCVLPGGHFFLNERAEDVRTIVEGALDHAL
ncbi:thioesterase II family protein [Streptomyces sp. NBC_00091]|uniref:thioesterase II family protein n=1 Tax=Streptomyces sp. NBC_00091 TaxID=2975648 RepID=UPI00225B50B1|nr:alpha/beta fold hydrolase [Streptomyces sp. NBC_00091]MCX5381168.1 alpha/beta fold hydrolase [Streptomyces sp. NBC_00091]